MNSGILTGILMVAIGFFVFISMVGVAGGEELGIFGMLVAIAGEGVSTGAVARSRGRAFLPWFLFGIAFFIIALPCALLLKPYRLANM